MNDRDARITLREAMQLHARAQGGRNRFSDERDGILTDLARDGASVTLADLDRWAHPARTSTPAAYAHITDREARTMIGQAVELHARAAGGNNLFSEERDGVLADLRAAGYTVPLADIDLYAHPVTATR